MADFLLSTLTASAWCLVWECPSASSFLMALAVGPIAQLLRKAGGRRPVEAPRQSAEALHWAALGTVPVYGDPLGQGLRGAGIRGSQTCLPHEDHCCLSSVKPECCSGDGHVPFVTHPFSAGMLLWYMFKSSMALSPAVKDSGTGPPAREQRRSSPPPVTCGPHRPRFPWFIIPSTRLRLLFMLSTLDG